MDMGKARFSAGIIATLIGVALLAGILFGWSVRLDKVLGVDRSLRDLSVALWAFLVPAWYQLEEAWFAPVGDPDEMERFIQNQKKARLTWTIIGGAAAIVIGISAPNLSD
jgi:hypothetical protein